MGSSCSTSNALIFGFFDREDFLHIFGLIVFVVVSHYIAYYLGFKRGNVRSMRYGPSKPLRLQAHESSGV